MPDRAGSETCRHESRNKIAIKGGDVYSTVSGIVDNAKIIASPNASIGEKIAAGLDIALDVGTGINTKDFKTAARIVEGGGEKTAGVAKTAMQRGRETEERMLGKLGHQPNKDKVSGREGNSIPDYLTKDSSGKVTGTGEIKDVNKQSLSKQLRIQVEAAKEGGYPHNLHVRAGDGTKVSEPARRAVESTGGQVIKDVQ